MDYTTNFQLTITHYKIQQKVKSGDLIRASGLKRPTWYKQYNNPQTMRIDTLIRICDYLNIPKGERADLLWGN